MASISPLLAVDDVAKSMDYYERVLKFEKGLALPGEDGSIMHGEAIIGDATVMFSPAAQRDGPVTPKLSSGTIRGAGVLLYFNLGDRDIDAYYDDVKSAGARVLEEIDDRFWGDRTFTVEDADGYILTFAKHVRDVDFSQMQAPS